MKDKANITMNGAALEYVMQMHADNDSIAEDLTKKVIAATKDAGEFKALTQLLFKRLRQYVPRGLCVICGMPALRSPKGLDVLFCNNCAGVIQGFTQDAQGEALKKLHDELVEVFSA